MIENNHLKRDIMKHTLKGWLVDNTVTADDKEDKILMLESAGSLTMEDIIEEMKREDTGLRTETLEHALKLFNRVTTDLLLNGFSVNTGLFHAVPQFRGVIENGAWNPERAGNRRNHLSGQRSTPQKAGRRRKWPGFWTKKSKKSRKDDDIWPESACTACITRKPPSPTV